MIIIAVKASFRLQKFEIKPISLIKNFFQDALQHQNIAVLFTFSEPKFEKNYEKKLDDLFSEEPSLKPIMDNVRSFGSADIGNAIKAKAYQDWINGMI